MLLICTGPDTIFTYDHGDQILFTCDAFGLHYCSDDLYDEDLSAISPDYRFYYDCLMAPNAPLCAFCDEANGCCW